MPCPCTCTVAPFSHTQAKLKAVEEKIAALERQYEEATAKKEQLARQVGEDPDPRYRVTLPSQGMTPPPPSHTLGTCMDEWLAWW
jgi:hypothetical protein